MCLCLSVRLFVRHAHYSGVLGPFGKPEVSLELFGECILYSKFKKISRACSHNFTQFSRNLGYFSHFWANFNMLGIKKHVLEPRNSSVILSRNFTHLFMQFHANFTQFSRNLDYFSHFWANFNMLGIKKHILELRNSLVVLGEAIGLKKGPKAPKKRPKASKRGRRPPKALRRS